MNLRVKICGLTRIEDALAAADAGADAVGFVFVAGTPRTVAVDCAAAIARALPPFVARVGVFADAPAALMEETAERAGLDWLQLHGDETPETCAAIRRPWYKAHRVGAGFDPAGVRRWGGPAFLLDSGVAGLRGGSGRGFDWSVARAAGAFGRVILAGGLTPDNVAEAIAAARPWAVDVSSGVEESPGIKDRDRVVRFVAAARAAAAALGGGTAAAGGDGGGGQGGGR
jgi:phosphoribosylanthranilate isomerase